VEHAALVEVEAQVDHAAQGEAQVVHAGGSGGARGLGGGGGCRRWLRRLRWSTRRCVTPQKFKFWNVSKIH
jgi:hypothetical protein